MIDSNNLQTNKYSSLKVSRETLHELDQYSKEILKRNKHINLISKNSEKQINSRHILDCAQTIDFINKSSIQICTDIGSGAGLPGIVIGILMKEINQFFKLIFYEKSYHKCIFLREMSKKFKLNSVIYQKNIFESKDLVTDVIISRAFKPLPIIFEIATNNFKNHKYIILFLGKSGKEILNNSLKIWKFDYEEKKSLTSDESIIVKIFNLKKKNG